MSKLFSSISNLSKSKMSDLSECFAFHNFPRIFINDYCFVIPEKVSHVIFDMDGLILGEFL